MAAHGSSVPASRWQARFPHEARGLHRNGLRTDTRSIVVGPAHRRFSQSLPRRPAGPIGDPWHILFFIIFIFKWRTAKGAEVFFFFENFGKLNLIFKKPQKRRPKFKFNVVISQMSKDREKEQKKE